MSTRTCGRPRQQGRMGDLRQQATSARTCGRPRQQGHVADHISKNTCGRPRHAEVTYTWHNQMMTSVKRKLARAMSTSDVSKLRHSGRIASGVSPPRNVKSPKSRRMKV
jgi:hypothetical protein